MPIKIEKISYTYQKNKITEKKALQEVSLNIEDGDIFGIYGDIGSGKSTLLQTMNGLIIPQKGKVIVDDINVIKAKHQQLINLRKKVGMVLQLPEQQLFEKTVFDEIAFGMRCFGFKDKDISERVRQASEALDLPFNDFKDRSPFTLSSGEKKRVVIASIIAARPKYMLLDEPTASMDLEGRKTLLKYIKNISKSEETTVVIVSHRLNDLLSICNKLAIMNHGKILFQGEVTEVLAEAEKACMIKPTMSRNIANKLKEKGIDVGQVKNYKELSVKIINYLKKEVNYN